VQGAFNAVVDVSGLLFGAFYILTALATMAYYRRRILASVWDALTLGLLPLAAAGFLGWVLAKSVQSAAPSQNWSLVGVVVVGIILMLIARYWLKSRFFAIARESDQPSSAVAGS
jgi:amino acid transporter